MRHTLSFRCLYLFLFLMVLSVTGVWGASPHSSEAIHFPPGPDSYEDQHLSGIVDVLFNRIRHQPFNLVATLIFFCAIVHTFLSGRFMAVAHKWEHQHRRKIEGGSVDRYSVHYGAELFHFLGEVEVVFGLWAAVLTMAIIGFFDWPTTVYYLTSKVNFVEPMFVVTIMILAATRPILKVSEVMMQKIATLLGGSLIAWWFTILTLGPVLGSFITEPAAMTISALLLSSKFFSLQPSIRLKYATLGLLFVNISVGGTLTHFAAPPVLMVAGHWGWDTTFMFTHFGWKALVGILAANGLYLLLFKKEFDDLQHGFAVEDLKHRLKTDLIKRKDLEADFEKLRPAASEEIGFETAVTEKFNEIIERIRSRLETDYLPRLQKNGVEDALIKEAFDKRFDEIRLMKLREFFPGLLPKEKRPLFIDPDWDQRDDSVPVWVIISHVMFMAWTIFNSHHPQIFIPGLLFFLGFARVSVPFQNRIDLKPPLLVGFFLGGLVIHGGVQGWWIGPVLGKLGEIPLMFGATFLTAFNDNAAITYLSTLVPGFTESLKYAVVAGAVSGGGLTVIANAPNPAGQSLLKKHFDQSVSPMALFKGAAIPTIIVLLCFLTIR